MDRDVENLDLNIDQPRTLGDWVKFADMAGVKTWEEIIDIVTQGPDGPRAAMAVFWMAGTQQDPDFDMARVEGMLLSPGGVEGFIEDEFGG